MKTYFLDPGMISSENLRSDKGFDLSDGVMDVGWRLEGKKDDNPAISMRFQRFCESQLMRDLLSEMSASEFMEVDRQVDDFKFICNDYTLLSNLYHYYSAHTFY